MGRYQGLTTAFVERLDAATAKLNPEQYVPVPSPAGPYYGLSAVLEALRDGRPSSALPPDHEARRLRLQQLAAERAAQPTMPEDPMSPGALLIERLAQLRTMLDKEAAEPPDPDVPTLEQLRADTIKQIQRENRETERRERMRLKRMRKKERKRLAAVQDAAPADVPT